MTKKIAKLSLLTCSLSLAMMGCTSIVENMDAEQPKKKNIILMISDGASDGTWDLAGAWEHGKLLNDTYPYNELTNRYALATYALNGNTAPTFSKDCDATTYAEGFGYSAEEADNNGKSEVQPFAAYEYLNSRYTDSAASGTAFATGQSTYNKAISVDNCGKELTLITEIAKANGLATGVVSSVPFSHATPAVFGANNISRHNSAKIGSDILTNGHLDLVMGTGHPMYDANGEQQEPKYNYITEASWNALQAQKLYAIGSDQPWQLVEEKQDFEQLINKPKSLEDGPLIGLVQNNSTLQQGRTTCTADEKDQAFACDKLATSPDLATMSMGALNYLNQNEDGFFVMIEGGAVDWAAHANDTARIIEEQVDFNKAVTQVYEWIEKNSNWDETLLIVTTDHGNSYVLGSDSDTEFYQAVPINEKNTMPSVKYYSQSHTNELVRLYAKGLGSEGIANYVIGNDPKYPTRYRHTGTNGDYLQNKHVFNLVQDIIEK